MTDDVTDVTDDVTDDVTGQPTVLRRLDTADATTLVHLVEMFEDLQTVLRCCERLVTELAVEPEADGVVVEAVWTLALLSYARCFAGGGDALGEGDLTTAQPTGDVLEWHKVMLALREHHADAVTNPRERFSVGVAQDGDGAPGGVAITSARQPLVDEVTVRQTGAVAFALSALLNERIEAQQEKVFLRVRNTSTDDLEKLARLDVAHA